MFLSKGNDQNTPSAHGSFPFAKLQDEFEFDVYYLKVQKLFMYRIQVIYDQL